MNNQEEYISAFKKLNLTPKYTWNGELETGLKFVDLPKGRVKLAWADTASTGSKPPVPIFRNKVYPAPVAP